MLPSIGWITLANKNNKKINDKDFKWLILGIIFVVIYAIAIGIASMEGQFGLVLQISLVFVLPFVLLEIKNKEGLVMSLIVLAVLFYGAGKFDSINGRIEIFKFLNNIGLQNNYYKKEEILSSFKDEVKDTIKKSHSNKVLVSKDFVRKTLSLGVQDGFSVQATGIDFINNSDEKVIMLYKINKDDFIDIVFISNQ